MRKQAKHKDLAYDAQKRTKYLQGNEFLMILEALEAVNTRIITLTRTMEETLKSLHIAPKVLCKRSNAMWDLLLGTEEDAKRLAESVLSTAAVCLQMEYMGTWQTKITVHGVSVDICKDLLLQIQASRGSLGY